MMKFYVWRNEHFNFENIKDLESSLGVVLSCYRGAPRFELALRSVLNACNSEKTMIFISWEMPESSKEELLSRIAKVLNENLKHNIKISLEIIEKKLGLSKHWQSSRAKLYKICPKLEFWCWAGDEDLMIANYLENAMMCLRQNTRAICYAPFPQFEHEDGSRTNADQQHSHIETFKVNYSRNGRWSSGNSIFGVFRNTKAIRKIKFRQTLLPDRLFMNTVALTGSVISPSSEVEWIRYVGRHVPLKDYRYQRKTVYSNNFWKLSSYFPWSLIHALFRFFDFCKLFIQDSNKFTLRQLFNGIEIEIRTHIRKYKKYGIK